MNDKRIDGELLINFLNELQPLSDKVIALARKETFTISVKKNGLLASAFDEQDKYLFIILKGLVRGFVMDEGKDITSVIADENHIIGHVRNPGRSNSVYEENFQALEESILLVLPYTFIDQLYLKFPEMNILGRKLLAIQLASSHERSILSRIPSAEARYHQFNISHPTLKYRVPLKFLASFLGMRIETLSRIRKRAKLGK